MTADGFDYAEVSGAIAAIKAAGAFPYIIAPKRSPIHPRGGDGQVSDITPTHHLEGFRSTLVDSILVPSGKISTLRKSGRAVHWIREAFAHCKAIGATGEGLELVKEAINGLVGQVKIADKAEVTESYGVVTGGEIPGEGKVKQGVAIAKETKDFLGQYFYAISKHRIYERELDGLVSLLAF